MKTKIFLVLSMVSGVTLTAFSDDSVRVERSFQYGKTFWKVSGETKNLIQVSNIQCPNDGSVQYTFEFQVTCSAINARMGFSKDAEGSAWQISETYCVKPKSTLVLSAKTQTSTLEALSRSAMSVLPTLEEVEGSGLNLDTQAANFVEAIFPGTKKAFTSNLTSMIYEERKEILSQAISSVVAGEVAAGNCKK
jgi:hypothetical protein